MAGEAKPKGRPSLYTDKLATEILDRLSKGEPLAAICRDDHMPAPSTVSDWKRAHPEFSVNFGRAREDGFDAIAAECLDIAEDGSRDFVKKDRPDGTTYEAFDAEHVQRSKLRIETRLKLLAKWDPRRYGEKHALIGGSEDDPPVSIRRIERTIVDPKPSDA